MSDKKTSLFLKVNIKDVGYTYIWSPEISKMDEFIIDSALPLFDEKISEPCVGYTATRLSKNKYLLIAGSYWANHKDQYGRSGLSFWCGAVVESYGDNLDLSYQLSNYMLGMLNQLNIRNDQVGDIISDLAKKKQKEEWSDVIFKLLFQLPPSVDAFTKSFTELVIKDKKSILEFEKVNLRSSFPLHSRMVIPCMLELLCIEPNRINKIGGGDLLTSRTKDIQLISTSIELKGYKRVEINSYLELLFSVKNTPQRISGKNTTSDSQKVVWEFAGMLILILSILFSAAFIVYRLLLR